MRARLAYTTHEAAQLLGVSLPTVVNWIKAGRIDAHRTPGGHRRIPVEALHRFAGEAGLPLASAPPGEPARPLPDAQTPVVLVVHAERDFSEMVGELLEGRLRCEARYADCAFSAGLEAGLHHPRVVVVDFGTPELDPLRLARVLRQQASAPALVGLVDLVDPLLAERAQEVGYRALLRQPVSLERLLDAVAEHLRLRRGASG